MIDRRDLVGRHDVALTVADPGVVLSVGNGDFGFTADLTGLQTFTEFHTPTSRGPSTDPHAARVTETCTMSSWGWHEVPNPDGYLLDDAMSAYETRRGPVRYPDRPSMHDLMAGKTPDRHDLAGMWLVNNPHRIDLGRLGLALRSAPGAEPETDPSVLTDLRVRLDLWSGTITSRFRYRGEPVEVTTLAHGDASVVATRVVSPLLASGHVRLRLAFPGPHPSFTPAASWAQPESHQTSVTDHGTGSATVHRQLDDTRYDVALDFAEGQLAGRDDHAVEITSSGDTLALVASFIPVTGPGSELGPANPRPARTFDEVAASSATFWEAFWSSGAAVDFAGSSDPRAHELERRVVLSQYLTRVHGGGLTPPQETGFVTNSWAGKFHLEMHWWHAAHFPTWGRPELLERSLGWYESVLDAARATAAQQGYAGARWPKQVGPDGRESPSDIGSLLVWQQPHLLYFAELLHKAAPPSHRAALLDRLAPLLDATADFMASFADDVDGVFHLGAPVMPAQEFYTAAETADPTFELAYWWFGLELAQRFRERRGLPREASWGRVQAGLARPSLDEDHYAAVAGSGESRTDDHPSMLMALGFVPSTPLIEDAVMRATLGWVRDSWQWDSAWGWDYAVMAMTAARLRDGRTAVDLLLRDGVKNTYDAAGHNPAMGSFLPLYLPGNGGLLAAVSLMVAGWEGGPELPGIPDDGTWRVAHEGFIAWP